VIEKRLASKGGNTSHMMISWVN